MISSFKSNKSKEKKKASHLCNGLKVQTQLRIVLSAFECGLLMKTSMHVQTVIMAEVPDSFHCSSLHGSPLQNQAKGI